MLFEEKYIEVTILTGGGGRFVCVFASAADAFIALNEYIVHDSRTCYYTDRMEELMQALLNIRNGKLNANQCNMFELRAVSVKED